MLSRGPFPIGGGGAFVTGGSGAATTLVNLRSWGTFSRTSEASALIGAPTDGTTAFLRWYAYGARRIENRGDGNGDMLLLEGARENMIYQTERFDDIWASSGGLTITNNACPAPTWNKFGQVASGV